MDSVLFKSLAKIIFGSKKKHPLEPHRPYCQPPVASSGAVECPRTLCFSFSLYCFLYIYLFSPSEVVRFMKCYTASHYTLVLVARSGMSLLRRVNRITRSCAVHSSESCVLKLNEIRVSGFSGLLNVPCPMIHPRGQERITGKLLA